MIYVVIDVATDKIVYAGPKESIAAERLAPGTTYGKAETETESYLGALNRAKCARWAYGELGLGPKQSFKPKLEPQKRRSPRRDMGKVQQEKPLPNLSPTGLVHGLRRRRGGPMH